MTHLQALLRRPKAKIPYVRVRRAACGVRRAACGVRRAACGVRRAACGVRRAACGCDLRMRHVYNEHFYSAVSKRCTDSVKST